MAKIIEIYQKNKIECDHCNYVVENENPNQLANIDEFINSECPKCQSNLLTTKDYLDYLSFVKLVNSANKWLGWLSFFFGSQKIETGSSTKVKIQNGITIKN